MKLIELAPTDGQKSFYGKAHVIIESDNETFTVKYTLFSYLEEICTIEKSHLFNTKSIKWRADRSRLSKTTERHVKAFMDSLYE